MKIKTYSNNLRLVVNTKKDVDVVSFQLFINAGAKNEKETEYGYAHFLEHMFFKSTKLNSYIEILKKLDDLGVVKNAYTGIGTTCYYFKSLSGKVEEVIKLYSEMFFNQTFKAEEIEKEKQVILEEYKMGQDNANHKCVRLGYKTLFNGTKVGHDVIGTQETIKSVTAQKLKNFKKKFYTPENVVISISGNISFNKAKKLVEKYFVNLFEQKTNNKSCEVQYFPLKPNKKYVHSHKDNEQSVVYILTDLKEKNLHERVIYNLYYAILGMDMSSKFFEIIRGQKGLVYSIDSDCTKLEKNYLSEIFFATSNDRVGEALTEIKQILKDCASGQITKEELERTKAKYVSGFVFSSESNSSIAANNGLDLIEYGKIISGKELTEEYNKVTLEEIIECAKAVYNETNYVVASVGNCKLSDLKKF